MMEDVVGLSDPPSSMDACRGRDSATPEVLSAVCSMKHVQACNIASQLDIMTIHKNEAIK